MVCVSNMNYNSSYYSTESYVSSENDLVAVYIELEPKNAPGSAIGNRDGSKPKVYCGLAQWNSTTHPTLDYNPEMGHNGMHRLHVTHINGEEEQDLTFESYDAITGTWVDPYDMTVKDGSVYIRNLVLTNVTNSTGNEDYFRYNAMTEAYESPTFTFNIDDIDNPEEENTYQVVIKMWRTNATASIFSNNLLLPVGSATITKTFTSPGMKSITWDGRLSDNGDPAMAEFGAYAYEMEVYKYNSVGALADWFALKWPYCLTVGAHSMYSKMVGDDEVMTIDFEISDGCYEDPNRAPYQSGVNIRVDALDYDLCHRGSKDFNNVSVGQHYTDEQLAKVYGYEEAGMWTSIYTGEDNCWKEYRRDHKGSRMLAANYNEESFPWRMYIYKYNGIPGHISVGFSWLYDDGSACVWTAGAWPQDDFWADLINCVSTIAPVLPGNIINWEAVGTIKMRYVKISDDNGKLMSQRDIIQLETTEAHSSQKADDAFSIAVPGKDAIVRMKKALYSPLYFYNPASISRIVDSKPNYNEKGTYNWVFDTEANFIWVAHQHNYRKEVYKIMLGMGYVNCVTFAKDLGNAALDDNFGSFYNILFPYELSQIIVNDHFNYHEHYTQGIKKWHIKMSDKFRFPRGSKSHPNVFTNGVYTDTDAGIVLQKGILRHCNCYNCVQGPISTYFKSLYGLGKYVITNDHIDEHCPCKTCDTLRKYYGYITWVLPDGESDD